MGGNKEFMIREHKVLRWYYEQFQQRLAIGGTRVMVIGYSFSDSPHQQPPLPKPRKKEP
jgi:hypothetical protein